MEMACGIFAQSKFKSGVINIKSNSWMQREYWTGAFVIRPQINANLALHQLVVHEEIVYVSSGGIYASVRRAPTS